MARPAAVYDRWVTTTATPTRTTGAPREQRPATRLRAHLLGARPTSALWGWLGPLIITAVGGGLRFWQLGRPHQLVDEPRGGGRLRQGSHGVGQVAILGAQLLRAAVALRSERVEIERVQLSGDLAQVGHRSAVPYARDLDDSRSIARSGIGSHDGRLRAS